MAGKDLRLDAAAIEVPANASRFFRTAEEAQSQPTAWITFGWDRDDPYLRNLTYEPSKIRHDESYCTSVVDLAGAVQVPTLTYFEREVLPHAPNQARVIDIGCGQGEFVTRLLDLGVDAHGFDPVLRAETDRLHCRYWTADERPADVYVMRCVLPHIENPWAFIDQITASSPDALVLIEFQDWRWIVEQQVWYQLSHDHVNVFTVDDFGARYDCVAQGSFSAGEWSWVLVRANSFRRPAPRDCSVLAELRALLAERRRVLTGLDRPVHLWGAAGKGIVLAHALVRSGRDVPAAIDADPVRWDLCLDVTGVPVVSPTAAGNLLPDDALVLVCNPNHRDAIREATTASWDVRLPSEIPT